MYFRSQTASKTQPLTSLSEDLKTKYSQAPKASSWGTWETAKHKASKTQPLTSLSEDLKTMYSQASKASSWMYSQAPKASSWETQPLTSLSEDLKTMYSQASKAPSRMYSQAPKASSWGTCETAKQHPKPRPGAPAKQPNNTQSLVLGHLRNNRKAVRNFKSLILRHLRYGPGFSGALPLTARGRRIIEYI